MLDCGAHARLLGDSCVPRNWRGDDARSSTDVLRMIAVVFAATVMLLLAAFLFRTRCAVRYSGCSSGCSSISGVDDYRWGSGYY
eukprot:scaffold35844_cov33-Phaeocystis_antarctica.AAC.1